MNYNFINLDFSFFCSAQGPALILTSAVGAFAAWPARSRSCWRPYNRGSNRGFCCHPFQYYQLTFYHITTSSKSNMFNRDLLNNWMPWHFLHPSYIKSGSSLNFCDVFVLTLARNRMQPLTSFPASAFRTKGRAGIAPRGERRPYSWLSFHFRNHYLAKMVFNCLPLICWPICFCSSCNEKCCHLMKSNVVQSVPIYRPCYNFPLCYSKANKAWRELNVIWSTPHCTALSFSSFKVLPFDVRHEKVDVRVFL